jgi:predicted lipoprotein with Yx(FWY)xxD motif
MAAFTPVIGNNYPGKRDLGDKADLYLNGNGIPGQRACRSYCAENGYPPWTAEMHKQPAAHYNYASRQKQQQ